jgi:muramoyltetrapeptide carboxypeptidase
VGIVAPASHIQRDLLLAGCATLKKLGYKPFYFDSIFDRELYFAGDVRRRVRELEEMFEREEVRAIICARGGYGCNYLLEELDLEKVRCNSKIFMGYSDITTLLTWFCDATNLVTFHGPMVTKDFAKADGIHLPSWEAAVSGSTEWQLDSDATRCVKSLREGTAEGMLYGGCLSLLSASLGTPYEIHTAGTILFLEDINARPYQVDRMLMQLRLAGKLDDVRGIIFGEMLDCSQPGGADYSLEQVVTRIVGDLEIPVVYGLCSGHVSLHNITLPLGVRATLSVGAETVELRILEPATAAEVVRSAKL